MSETKRKVPKLRFPGFTEDWEQRKLIDYLKVSSDKNKDNKFGKADVLSVSGEYGIVNQIEFQGRSFAGVSVANYGVVEIGDVVYTKSPLKANPYGIIKTNKLSPGIVSTLYAVYKPLENIDSDFVQVYFEHDGRMNNYMKPLVNKGAKNDMKVTDENALKGDVIFPAKEEQEHIVKCFSTLDNLITLHQRKLESLKLKKKALLQKMFTKNGEQFPELRFPGFTDAWEQRKLGEIVEKEIKGKAQEAMLGSETLYLDTEYLNGGIARYVDLDEDVQEDDLIILWDGSQAGTLYHGAKGALGSTLKAYRLTYDSRFIYQQMKGQQEIIFNRYRTPNIPHVIKTFTKEFIISITSEEEAKKIADILFSFDNLITLHQRKYFLIFHNTR